MIRGAALGIPIGPVAQACLLKSSPSVAERCGRQREHRSSARPTKAHLSLLRIVIKAHQ
ncbi:hypothetical protein D3C85_796040 [compost metagenome]